MIGTPSDSALVTLEAPGLSPTTSAAVFFDVFTELSVDGGENWIAADGPIHMAGSALKDFYAEGEPIFWPTREDSWDMAFLLTTQEISQELDWGDAPEDTIYADWWAAARTDSFKPAVDLAGRRSGGYPPEPRI